MNSPRAGWRARYRWECWRGGRPARDEIDTAVAVTGKKAKRASGKLPPHVMVYFTMAMALYADHDCEGVLARLTDAVLVADMLTPRAFLGPWRLVAIDGMEWDVPDTPANVAAFGYAGSGASRSAFPKVRLVALSECASHAWFATAIGGAVPARAPVSSRWPASCG